jgi:hypothetical protein
MLKCRFIPPLLLRYFIKFCQAAKLILASFIILIASTKVLAVSPTLIDLGVNDTPPLQLTTGVDYLIVINNDNPHGASFYFGEFAQGVLTHYLQGAASVSQDSVDVPANAKVQWLLSPIKAGEYAYYAVNNGGSEQKGDKGKITVTLAEGVNQAPSAKVEETLQPEVRSEVKSESKSEVKQIKVSKKSDLTAKSLDKNTLVINERTHRLRGGRRD